MFLLLSFLTTSKHGIPYKDFKACCNGMHSPASYQDIILEISHESIDSEQTGPKATGPQAGVRLEKVRCAIMWSCRAPASPCPTTDAVSFFQSKHRGYLRCLICLWLPSNTGIACSGSFTAIQSGPLLLHIDRGSRRARRYPSSTSARYLWQAVLCLELPRAIAFIIDAFCLIVWIKSVVVSQHFGRDSICSLWRYGACGLRSCPTCTGGELDQGIFITILLGYTMKTFTSHNSYYCRYLGSRSCYSTIAVDVKLTDHPPNCGLTATSSSSA
jgi:hypothetical protein